VRLLLDTQILVWMVNGDRRLTSVWQKAMASPDADLCVSAVVACEYTDLQMRGRLPVDESMSELIERFTLAIEDFPADAWEILRELPQIHRDPVDRMLVAHAMRNDTTLITADANIRQYPVHCV
jgi:PIN domain nuclease of toxin-antitoxin system